MRLRHLSAIFGLLGLVVVLGAVLALKPDPVHEFESPALVGVASLSPTSVDRVVIRAAAEELTITKWEARWMVGPYTAFGVKLDSFWDMVHRLAQAPIVARNPQNHAALGLVADTALVVQFWRGSEAAGELLVGNWSMESQSTFVRGSGDDAVVGMPRDLRSFLVPSIDRWRDPVIVDVANVRVRTLHFSYPDEEFSVTLVTKPGSTTQATTAGSLRQDAATDYRTLTGQTAADAPNPTPSPDPGRPVWVIQTATSGSFDAAPERIVPLLSLLAPLWAVGFADDERAVVATMAPALLLEIEGSAFGVVASLEFYPRDTETFYVRKVGTGDLFLLDSPTVSQLMRRPTDLAGLLTIETAPPGPT